MSSKSCARNRNRAQLLEREPAWANAGFAILAFVAAMAVTAANASESAPGSSRSEGPTGEVAHAVEVFRDDFLGNALLRHWLVAATDVQSQRVSDGALRLGMKTEVEATAQTGGRIRLSEPLPASDWAVSVELRLRLGTGAEVFDLVVARDQAHWIGVRLRASPNKYSGHRLMLGLVESDGGLVRGREAPLVEIACNVCGSAWSWRGFSRQLVDDRNLVLRIEKRGPEFLASAELGRGDTARRVEVGPLHSRIDARELAVEFARCGHPDVRQGADPSGASSVAIESIAVEALVGRTLVASDSRSDEAPAN